jgi:hypothetical protein
MRRPRKIVGQYSFTTLLAAVNPIRTPYLLNVRVVVCSFAGK